MTPATPPPTFEGHVQLDDVRLFVRRFGASGPEVVLIHGGPDWDQSYFFPFIAPLIGHCRLTAFDLRGCGRSQRLGDPARYHIDLAVDDLIGLISRLEIQQPILLGFSYGVRVALRAIAHRLGIARALILASSTAYDDVQVDLTGWDEYSARNSREQQQAVRAMLESPDLPSADKTRRMAQMTLTLDMYDPRTLPRASAAIDRIAFSGEWMDAWLAGNLAAQHPDYGAVLTAIGLPSLILHGDKDMRFPVSVALRLARHVPRAQLTILPQTGHLAHIEATDAWNAAVIAFVSQFG